MRRKVRSRRTGSETLAAFFCREDLALLPYKVDGSGKGPAIDDDFNRIAVVNVADRAIGKSLWRDMADAGSRGDPAEASVSQHSDVLAVRECLQRSGDLVDLLHARTERTAADQHHNVAFKDISSFDGLNRRGLSDEDPRRSAVTVDSRLVDQRGVNGRALDH